MTFKTEAELYRYLLDKEGNVVENSHGVKIKFAYGALVASAPNKDRGAWVKAPAINGYFCQQWRPLEKKEWWEVAKSGKLIMQNGPVFGVFQEYRNDHEYPIIDIRAHTWSEFTNPVPSSTIREWLAEAERVERECNL